MNYKAAAIISIHAPHEGERPRRSGAEIVGYTISIHAPHEGERRISIMMAQAPAHFNPRSPRGGATRSASPPKHAQHISIHAPHEGERLRNVRPQNAEAVFQSTLPTRGSDVLGGRRSPLPPIDFNPRSPRGGATSPRIIYAGEAGISIHAPHEGERQRKSAFVCSISANLLNIIHCGAVTRAVSRRRIALFRLFSVRRSGVFMYAYASH